jgi:hypothetical protein
MITKLQVDYKDSNNLKVFRLEDSSEYNPKIPIECGLVEVTVPGFKYSKTFEVKPYFNFALNASILDIAKAKSHKDLVDLPDGIYNIKYSVKPNTVLNVEYDYFRTAKLMERFAKVSCDFLDSRPKLTKQEFLSKQKDLFWIKLLIDSSKYKVEECGDSEKGIELYNEASDLLKKYVFCSC